MRLHAWSSWLGGGRSCALLLDDRRGTGRMRVVVNAVSAKRGGAVTYLKNVLPELRRQLGSPDGHRIVVWRATSGNGDGGWPEGIEYREDASATGSRKAVGGTISRVWFDQVRLPSLLREETAQVLFS